MGIVLFTSPPPVSKVGEWRVPAEGTEPPGPLELRNQSKWNVVNITGHSPCAYFLSTTAEPPTPFSSPPPYSFVLPTVHPLAVRRTDSAVPAARARDFSPATPSACARLPGVTESLPSPAGTPGTPLPGPLRCVGVWLRYNKWGQVH